MKIFASVYIGSYEVTMRVYEVNRSWGLNQIDCLKMPVDIIRDVLNVGKISPETTNRLCKILQDLKRVMDSYKCDGYSIIANSNLRLASNEFFVLEQIKIKTGFHLQVIST